MVVYVRKCASSALPSYAMKRVDCDLMTREVFYFSSSVAACVLAKVGKPRRVKRGKIRHKFLPTPLFSILFYFTDANLRSRDLTRKKLLNSADSFFLGLCGAVGESRSSCAL